VVWSSLMIHHLPTPIKLKALKEMRRVLKPGGKLYLIDFDLIAPIEALKLIEKNLLAK